MARLSTHVLDLANGHPAGGLRIELFTVKNGARELVCHDVTNIDGRTAQPLIEGETIPTGIFELVFHASEYLHMQGHPLTDPPFLDEVVIRFGIGDATANYHIPLLLSPFGYSTYRGS